jgi:outer membrane protein assembly factor BamB
MKKKLLIGILLILISLSLMLTTLFLVWKFYPSVSYKSDNFPLRQQWKTRIGKDPLLLSLADNETVLVRTIDALYALDLKTGVIQWRQNLSFQADPQPAHAVKGKIYLADGDGLIALDQINGSVLWKRLLFYQDSRVVDATEKVVLVDEAGRNLSAFNADSGQLLWKLPGGVGNTPGFIDNGLVYYPDNGIHAVDEKTGLFAWKGTDESRIGYVDYEDDVIFYSLSDSIVALNVLDQNEEWRIPIGITGFEKLKVYKEFLFYTDSSKLCAFTSKDGYKLWCNNIAFPQSPSVVEDVVYVYTGNRKEISAYQISTGKEIGRLSFSNPAFFIIERQLMIASDDHLLFGKGPYIFDFGK